MLYALVGCIPPPLCVSTHTLACLASTGGRVIDSAPSPPPLQWFWAESFLDPVRQRIKWQLADRVRYETRDEQNGCDGQQQFSCICKYA